MVLPPRWIMHTSCFIGTVYQPIVDISMIRLPNCYFYYLKHRAHSFVRRTVLCTRFRRHKDAWEIMSIEYISGQETIIDSNDRQRVTISFFFSNTSHHNMHLHINYNNISICSAPIFFFFARSMHQCRPKTKRTARSTQPTVNRALAIYFPGLCISRGVCECLYSFSLSLIIRCINSHGVGYDKLGLVLSYDVLFFEASLPPLYHSLKSVGLWKKTGRSKKEWSSVHSY